MGFNEKLWADTRRNTEDITTIKGQIGYQNYFDLESFMLTGTQVSSSLNLSTKELSMNLSGATYSHVALFFLNAKEEMIFNFTRDDTWLLIGGSGFSSFSALNINYTARPTTIRLADLGASIRTRDLTCSVNSLAIGMYLKIKWNIDNIEIYYSNDNQYSWSLLTIIDVLISAPTIINWINYKNLGMVTDRASSTIVGKDFQIHGELNTNYKTYKNYIDIQKLKPLSGKTWNAVGDSITAQGKYITPIVDLTEMIVSNKGIASTTIAVNNTYLTAQSMVEKIPSYADADVWTLLGGVNDWLYDSPIGTISSTDTATVYGALKSICENILGRSNNPNLILFTPLQSDRNGTHNLISMSQIRQAIKDVGERYAVPVIDLYSIGGICTFNLSSMTADGIHPSDLWASIYPERISRLMTQYANA